MKKILAFTTLALIASSASAFDYKLSLEGRGDFVNATVKTKATAGTTTTQKYNNFSNNLVRINLMGNINDNLNYRFRYRFLSSAAAPTGINSTGVPTSSTREIGEGDKTVMDYLYVDHKNQYFTTRFGRQNWVDAFGREAYLSGTDVFIKSQAAMEYQSAVGDYRWGVTGIYKFADTNNFLLALSNPNKTLTDTSGLEQKNNSLAMGAYYNGSFAEKKFQPTLGYTLAKQDGDKEATLTITTPLTKSGDITIWNAGFRSELAGFVIDADYKVFNKENRNAGATTTFVKENTKSIYSMLSYTAGEFTPIAFYVNDKFDSETNTADFKRNAFAIGTFWKPFDDVNFRYHLMFTNDVKKFESTTATNSKITDRRMYFGIKADI